MLKYTDVAVRVWPKKCLFLKFSRCFIWFVIRFVIGILKVFLLQHQISEFEDKWAYDLYPKKNYIFLNWTSDDVPVGLLGIYSVGFPAIHIESLGFGVEEQINQAHALYQQERRFNCTLNETSFGFSWELFLLLSCHDLAYSISENLQILELEDK